MTESIGTSDKFASNVFKGGFIFPVEHDELMQDVYIGVLCFHICDISVITINENVAISDDVMKEVRGFMGCQ